MKNITLKHAVFIFIATSLLVNQNTIAQVGYVASDNSLYYMNF